MGLFNGYQKEGKGVSKNQNTPRPILFFQIYFRKFWNLIILNMIYLLFCIPVITIGPATAGMTKILRNYAREEHAFLWGDFIETFKKNFKQSFIFSLIDGAILLFLVFDLRVVTLLMGSANKIMLTISMAAILFTITVYVFMRYYIYSMMITFKLNLRQLFKNAFIFCWAAFFKNLFLTAIILGLTAIMIYKCNIILLLFILITLYFSTVGLLINFFINPTIKKYMIDGFDPETGERLEEEKYEGFED